MKTGAIAVILAYLLWGFFPVYWKTLVWIPAEQILFHRLLWSFIGVIAIVVFRRRLRLLLSAFRDRDTVLKSIAAAICLFVNWYAFLWTMGADRVIESSLGYFLCPLFSVLWGRLFLGEGLNLLRSVAIGFAFAGVAWMIILVGEIPVAALIIAISWSLYGLAKKKTVTGPYTSLAMETTWLLPFSLAAITWFHQSGTNKVEYVPWSSGLHIASTGLITLLPLFLYAYAAPKVTLATLGLFQFLVPSIFFFLAVFLYGEPFSTMTFVGFILIWIGVGIYIRSLLVKPQGFSQESSSTRN